MKISYLMAIMSPYVATVNFVKRRYTQIRFSPWIGIRNFFSDGNKHYVKLSYVINFRYAQIFFSCFYPINHSNIPSNHDIEKLIQNIRCVMNDSTYTWHTESVKKGGKNYGKENPISKCLLRDKLPNPSPTNSVVNRSNGLLSEVDSTTFPYKSFDRKSETETGRSSATDCSGKR